MEMMMEQKCSQLCMFRYYDDDDDYDQVLWNLEEDYFFFGLFGNEEIF